MLKLKRKMGVLWGCFETYDRLKAQNDNLAKSGKGEKVWCTQDAI